MPLIRTATLVIPALLLAGCGYEPMSRLNKEEQCWEFDRPDDVDLSSCDRRGPGASPMTILTLQDADGNCWRLPYCGGYSQWIEEHGWGPYDGETCTWDMYRLPRC